MRNLRHVFHAGVGKVSAGDLPRAFEQMADHGRASQAQPVIQMPAKLIRQRRHKQGRVGHSSGDDQLRARLEGGDDGVGAEIGVCAHQFAVGGQGLA